VRRTNGKREKRERKKGKEKKRESHRLFVPLCVVKVR
jgi:hypothetical protein